jgi:hypothetical protein
MFKKADPLVDSVKIVMEQNSIRREVERLVNEEFGVTSRKGLPHELHAEYDAALKEATEATLNEISKDLAQRTKHTADHALLGKYDKGGPLASKWGAPSKHAASGDDYDKKADKLIRVSRAAQAKLGGHRPSNVKPAKVLAKEETEAPKTARINESFEHFLRNRFLKD